jgi:hypothetical protein
MPSASDPSASMADAFDNGKASIQSCQRARAHPIHRLTLFFPTRRQSVRGRSRPGVRPRRVRETYQSSCHRWSWCVSRTLRDRLMRRMWPTRPRSDWRPRGYFSHSEPQVHVQGAWPFLARRTGLARAVLSSRLCNRFPPDALRLSVTSASHFYKGRGRKGDKVDIPVAMSSARRITRNLRN